jgi:hypothetical protein
MEQDQNGFMGSAQYERRFRFQAERENLLSNLTALRRTLWEMRASLHHLEQVCKEVRDTQAEVECLREQINIAAERIGLEPIPGREA